MQQSLFLGFFHCEYRASGAYQAHAYTSCARTCAYMHTCIHAHRHTHTHANKHLCGHTYTYTSTCTHPLAHTNTLTYTHTCANRYSDPVSKIQECNIWPSCVHLV